MKRVTGTLLDNDGLKRSIDFKTVSIARLVGIMLSSSYRSFYLASAAPFLIDLFFARSPNLSRVITANNASSERFAHSISSINRTINPSERKTGRPQANKLKIMSSKLMVITQSWWTRCDRILASYLPTSLVVSGSRLAFPNRFSANSFAFD